MTRLTELADDVKAILGSETIVTYGADWTEYGAHVVDEDADEVRFPLDALWASPPSTRSASITTPPLADWRDGADPSRPAAGASSTYDPAYLAGNLRGGEAYDWFYADDAARNAQTRTPITDGARQAVGVPRQGSVGTGGRTRMSNALAALSRRRPPGSPQGSRSGSPRSAVRAVDKGANGPNTFPDPKSSEGGVPHFSNGQPRRSGPAPRHRGGAPTFDPAHRAPSGRRNPISSVYGGRDDRPVDASSVGLGRAAFSGLSRGYGRSGAMRELGDRSLAHRPARGRAPLDRARRTILVDFGIAGVAAPTQTASTAM